MGGHGSGEIDPVHEASAEQGVQRIRIVRQNDLGHFRDRFAHRPWVGQLRIVVVVHKSSDQISVLPGAICMKITSREPKHTRI